MSVSSYFLYTHANYHEDSTTTLYSKNKEFLLPHTISPHFNELNFYESLSQLTTSINLNL